MPDVTLTFDNGPTEATGEVLDLLARHDVKTTFFLVGQELSTSARRQQAERAAGEGHWIGNHTYSHSVAFGDDTNGLNSIAEVARAQAAIAELAGGERLFRPFGSGGHLDRRLFNLPVLDYLCRMGYTVVLWNAVPRDWVAPDWVDRAMDQCRSQPWTLLVLHDAYGRALPGLATFLDRAKEAGFHFRQDFPPDCVPVVRGKVTAPLDHLTAAASVR